MVLSGVDAMNGRGIERGGGRREGEREGISVGCAKSKRPSRRKGVGRPREAPLGQAHCHHLDSR